MRSSRISGGCKLAGALLVLTTAWAVAQSALAPLYAADHPDRVPGEYIVVLHPEGSLDAQGLSPQRLTGLAGVDVRSRFGIDGPSGVTTSSAPPSDGEMSAPLTSQGDAPPPSLRGFTAHLNDDALRRIRQDSSVRYVEASTILRASGRDVASWGLDRLDQRGPDLDGRFEVDWLSEGRWVYVVDSGVRRSHPELEGRVRYFSSVIHDGRGADDCGGHGTAVASLIAGRTLGVVSGANLWSMRVLGCDGRGSTAGIVTALTWLRDNAIPGIVNLSLGGGAWSPSFEQAIEDGRNRGFLYIAAAGNNGSDACDFFPAAYPGVIAVGASTSGDARASFSNYGPCVDVFAPGASVRIAVIDNEDRDTGLGGGTSFAAPYVAGIAALFVWGPFPQTLLEDCVTEGALTDVRGAPNRLVYARLDLCTERPTAPTASWPGTLAPPGGDLPDGELTFHWSPSFGLVAPIEGYELRLVDDVDGRVVHREFDLSRTQATVSWLRLSPGRTYRWDVRAVDRYGPGPRSRSRYVVRPATGVPHDQFRDARAIAGTSGLLVGSNDGASFEPDEPDHTLDTFTDVGPFDRASVWYVWEAPSSGRVVFDTAGSEIGALVAAYVENTPGAGLVDVTDVGRDDDLSDPPVRIEFQADAGTTYFVAVDSYDGTGDYEIAWRLGDAPENDGVQQASILGGAEGRVEGSNHGADVARDEPDPTEGSGGLVRASVWYEWEAPSPGPVTFEATGIDSAPVLTAYRRQPGGEPDYTGLRRIASDPAPLDGASAVWFEARKGVRYFMSIDTLGTTGSFELAWSAGQPGVAVRVSGAGHVSSTPTGIDCPEGGACTATFEPGTVVTLHAEGVDGTSIRDWTGCQAVIGTECVVTIEGPTAVDAAFAPVDRGTPTCKAAWYAANPLGDMDRDGTLSSGDALRTLQLALEEGAAGDDYERLHADVDGDRTVSPEDALAALRRSAGDPSGPRLRVAPLELEVEPGGEACLIVFNAAAGPLPLLALDTSDGVVASEIVDTGRPGYGRLFRVTVMPGVSAGDVEVATDGAGSVTVPVRVP